jgi:hypothetical protein
VSEPAGVGGRGGSGLPTFLGRGEFGRSRAEDDAVRAKGVLAQHHLKFADFLLWGRQLRQFLFRKRLQLDPAALVAQDLRMVQLRVQPSLTQRAVQSFLGLVLVVARPQCYDLHRVLPSVYPVAHPPHLCESACTQASQVFEVGFETLGVVMVTSWWVIF